MPTMYTGPRAGRMRGEAGGGREGEEENWEGRTGRGGGGGTVERVR